MQRIKLLQRSYEWHKAMPDISIWQIREPAKKEKSIISAGTLIID